MVFKLSEKVGLLWKDKQIFNRKMYKVSTAECSTGLFTVQVIDMLGSDTTGNPKEQHDQLIQGNP